MWPDRVSNPGPLTYESGALPTALRGSAIIRVIFCFDIENGILCVLIRIGSSRLF